MTNVGKWTPWYQGLEAPWPYGETTGLPRRTAPRWLTSSSTVALSPGSSCATSSRNYEWVRILDNGLVSFTERMALILFTPEQDATEEIAFQSDIGVPDIAFRLADITDAAASRCPAAMPTKDGWAAVG
jgi:hypothetical protein